MPARSRRSASSLPTSSSPIAASAYLKKRGELRARHLVIAAIAILCLLVPLIGSFYPAPTWPVSAFPYIFLGYMAVGGAWLFVQSRRRVGILSEIEADLENAPAIHAEAVGCPTLIDLTAEVPASAGAQPG